MTHQSDVIIIGAGPVGLFAIFECGMMGLSCQVIDALDQVGGQCAALYPEKPIFDIPAYPTILAADLIENLKAQAAPFNPTYHLSQQVTSLQSKGEGYEIVTSKGHVLGAKCIIIAAGVGAFGPNRPPLEGIENYEATSIDYFITNKEKYRGKKVVIAGGGDSAVDWALSLEPIASKVYVVHRRPKFRAAPESVSKLNTLAENGAIELVVPYQLDGLQGNGQGLSGVTVATLEGEKKVLEADYLLPFFGLSMNLGPIAEWGLQLDKSHIQVDPTTMETSLKGIFAIGDIASYPHKLKLILSGFSEGAQAAHQARARIHPDQVFHFEYSTTSGVPGLKAVG